MIKITSRMFFTAKPVMRAVDKATRRVLSRFGAFVRQTAKRSIRPRKRASRPGQPPSSHTGLLKRFIFFGYAPDKRSVVIGPQRLSKKGRGDFPGAPALLEHGGTTTLKRRGKRVKAKVRQRPYMGPAFEKEQPQLPALWRNSIPRN